MHPNALPYFDDYNQFLEVADALLEERHLDGIFQIASFHPDYQFAGTFPDDAENFTNRSPYPLLHLLREESVEKAIEQHADAAKIPDTNIAKLNQMGTDVLVELLGSFKD